ncbi:delta(1)-pyrroline-2-carboxylate reductase family protein [Komagataeibacter melomenusus]
MKQYSAQDTRALLPFPALIDALAQAALDTAAGQILCPERTTIRTRDQRGALMSMPCVGDDIMVTKLLTLFAGNPARGLPSIQGQVICAEAQAGRFLFTLDGPTVTMRRTAAISLLGIRTFAHAPVRRVLMIGTGTQAVAHLQALAAVYPGITVVIRGRTAERARAFCAAHAMPGLSMRPEQAHEAPCDVVLTLTASTTAIYDAPARASCLVIGVGAYRTDMVEIGPTTIAGSALYVDDPIGAPSEAGDLYQAGVDWQNVHPLARALQGRLPAPDQPVFFKSVGCAAWDLAACRVARQQGG